MNRKVYRDGNVLRIPRKTVEFENGDLVTVEPFLIWSQPVRISEFAEFVRATGFATAAEREGDRSVYFDNQAISALDPDEIPEHFATCVTYGDACAYCQWRGLRLPTEAEWLAFSIMDETIYDEADPLSDEALRKFIRSQHAKGIYIDTEWTSSSLDGRHRIVRASPAYARTLDWREIAARSFMAPDYRDLVLTFRVAGEGLARLL